MAPPKENGFAASVAEVAAPKTGPLFEVVPPNGCVEVEFIEPNADWPLPKAGAAALLFGFEEANGEVAEALKAVELLDVVLPNAGEKAVEDPKAGGLLFVDKPNAGGLFVEPNAG